MKHLNTILFVIVLSATVVWFGALGMARAQTTRTSKANVVIFTMISASMAWVGETLLRHLLPVLRLKRRQRLFARRAKTEQKAIKRSRARIIGVEQQGFAYNDQSARYEAAHAIARDHAIATAATNQPAGSCAPADPATKRLPEWPLPCDEQ